MSNLDYKEGRGDYYLAEGIRESRCNATLSDQWAHYCRRDKGHDGDHSETRYNADEDESLHEPYR